MDDVQKMLLVLAAAAFAFQPSGNLLLADSRGYAVIVSENTVSNPHWKEVVAALTVKHRARDPIVITWRQSPREALPALVQRFPEYACFVATPQEASRDFVREVHQLTRTFDTDPYTDTLWGILTGFDAANALAIASTTDPLTVRRVTSGTELAMDRIVEGEWYSEIEKGHMARKRAGEESKMVRGPDDTTAILAERLSSGATDLFVTSGHATERDWQIGYGYRNGCFRSGGGKLWGVDTKGQTFPIHSDNPKIWLAVGNCLAGHIDGPDAMALSFMNAVGVHQMIGYTVPTWYGYAGWGILDYFVEQPGRFTLCEAFHANGHALVHRLNSGAAPEDAKGLTFDRDVTAFYGDPAWEVRMAEGKLQFDQTLTEHEGIFTLLITPRDGERSFTPVNTNGSQRGGRPIVEFLSQSLAGAEIIEGEEWKPLITDSFVLVPLPLFCPSKPMKIVFRERQRPIQTGG